MIWSRPVPEAAGEMPRLTYVTTAHQFGVVGYRDPAGAISPDGTRVAYSEGRRVFVIPVGGGAPQVLPDGESQIRYLTWAAPNSLIAEEAGSHTRWWEYAFASGQVNRRPLWKSKGETVVISDGPLGSRMTGDGVAAESTIEAINNLRQLSWSPDGRYAAAIVNGSEGPFLLRIDSFDDPTTGDRFAYGLKGRPTAAAWTPSGEVACISSEGGRARLSIPCGGPVLKTEPAIDIVGPIAFSPDGKQIYCASPNAFGMVELWRIDRGSLRAQRATSFSRDAYAPSIAVDGTVLFKVQTYRTFVADAPAAGGASRQLTAFQAETPSWHPTKPLVSFTYGTWRRVMDDAKYPDIAQEIGAIDLGGTLPAAKPTEVIAQSDSEDQAMAWSPNGRWIAFHTHREMSDDVWLRPADGKAADKRITFLGRGAEVGWPRWSPDGSAVLLDGARKGDGRSVIYVIGVDQNTGEVTSQLREVTAEGFEGELTHAEWMPTGTAVVALAREGPGRQAILTLPVTGGRPTVVRRWQSEHDFSGLGVSPDGRSVAFTAPAADGFFQIYRVPMEGGTPVQVTQDPSNKSQPSWSPDGARIAFTVWSYEAAFWTIK